MTHRMTSTSGLLTRTAKRGEVHVTATGFGAGWVEREGAGWMIHDCDGHYVGRGLTATQALDIFEAYIVSRRLCSLD